MTLYYHVTKPDEMYVKVERDTVEEIEQFLKENFDGFQFEHIQEDQVPPEMVFRKRWGMFLGVLPERRKKPR